MNNKNTHGKGNALLTVAMTVLLAAIIFYLASTTGGVESPKYYKVMLNGKTWFYVQDKNKLEALLEDYKAQYTSKIDKNARIQSVVFNPKVEIIEDDSSPGDRMLDLKEAKQKIYARTRTASYVEVKAGENASVIAQNNNMTVEELKKLNPQLNQDMLMYPGDRLMISPDQPVLEVVVTYESTVEQAMAFAVNYVKDSSMNQGQKKIMTPGVAGKQQVTYQVVQINGRLAEQKIISQKVIQQPVTAQAKIGTRTTVSRSGSYFGVLRSGRITSYFGMRIHPITGKKTFHEGVDIASPEGSSIYAYASGVVTYAGWKNGYGNFVAINHGNGLVTRYGHMSAIYVSVGERVTTGQRIGAVGSTGESTGPHLHFEVVVNGVNKNPLDYL
jgi:murein DD-endopeptidase MepM/ murein hydrolase activator NlpD